jgi:hypothetical protein
MKEQKYTRPCELQGYDFKPFILETYGAFGTTAQQIIKAAAAKIADKLPDNHLSKLGMRTWTASSFKAHFMQRISISLQRGNAKAIIRRARRDFKLAGQDERDASPPRDHYAPQ